MDLLGKPKAKVEPKENQVLLKQLKDRVMEVFKIFDFYGMDCVQNEWVGHVLRMLGCVPLESEIVELIGQCEHPTEKGKVRFDDFFKIFFAWLLDEKMKPADEDTLLHCLQTIGTADGITENRLATVAKEYGESMTDEQLKTMLSIAVDKKTDRVIYDSFACKIFQQPSIYEFAKEIMKPIEPAIGSPDEPKEPKAKKSAK